MYGMGNLEELRELEKKITHPEAAAAVREAIEGTRILTDAMLHGSAKRNVP